MACNSCGKDLRIGEWPWCPHGYPVVGISVIDDKHPGHFTEVVKLQHLWIDRQYAGKGYGNRLLEIVTSAVLKTDQDCKSGILDEPCFSVCLFPRRFDFPADLDLQALVDGESEYDVSLDKTAQHSKAIKPIDDIMITEFDASHLLDHRPDIKCLVKFYKNKGFVQNKFFEIKTMLGKDGIFHREIGVMGVTFVSMLRSALVFPASNNDFWNDFSKRMIAISNLTPDEAIEAGLMPSGHLV